MIRSCNARKNVGLHRQIHVADFVEKQRSLVGVSERPRVVGHRSGKCAAGVAEQLAFQQI
jgi:hypothetical protein